MEQEELKEQQNGTFDDIKVPAVDNEDDINIQKLQEQFPIGKNEDCKYLLGAIVVYGSLFIGFSGTLPAIAIFISTVSSCGVLEYFMEPGFYSFLSGFGLVISVVGFPVVFGVLNNKWARFISFISFVYIIVLSLLSTIVRVFLFAFLTVNWKKGDAVEYRINKEREVCFLFYCFLLLR